MICCSKNKEARKEWRARYSRELLRGSVVIFLAAFWSSTISDLITISKDSSKHDGDRLGIFFVICLIIHILSLVYTLMSFSSSIFKPVFHLGMELTGFLSQGATVFWDFKPL